MYIAQFCEDFVRHSSPHFPSYCPSPTPLYRAGFYSSPFPMHKWVCVLQFSLPHAQVGMCFIVLPPPCTSGYVFYSSSPSPMHKWVCVLQFSLPNAQAGMCFIVLPPPCTSGYVFYSSPSPMHKRVCVLFQFSLPHAQAGMCFILVLPPQCTSVLFQFSLPHAQVGMCFTLVLPPPCTSEYVFFRLQLSQNLYYDLGLLFHVVYLLTHLVSLLALRNMLNTSNLVGQFLVLHLRNHSYCFQVAQKTIAIVSKSSLHLQYHGYCFQPYQSPQKRTLTFI